MTNGSKKYNRSKRRKRPHRQGRQSIAPQTIAPQALTLAKRKWKPASFQHDPRGIPLILFGRATLGKDLVHIKGLPHGSTNVLYENLKRREANGDLLVILVDEYLTSQICSNYQHRDLVKMPGVRGFSVLKCRNCHTKWQRDVNAARNILTIAYSVWTGAGVPTMNNLAFPFAHFVPESVLVSVESSSTKSYYEELSSQYLLY